MMNNTYSNSDLETINLKALTLPNIISIVVCMGEPHVPEAAISDEHYQICSQMMKTDVTAVEIIADHVFAGIGRKLYIFNISTKKCVHECYMLQKQRIHGIRVSNDLSQLICFGSREAVVSSIEEFSIKILNRFNVGDWIWDIKWRNDEMIILSANNVVTLWNWRTESISRIINQEKCLLYCGIILGDEWNRNVIVGGSMFKCILVWAPSINKNGCSRLLHKITAHKGAIFSVFYHDKLHRLCSTSDDRSVQIRSVTFPVGCQSIVDSWSEACFSLVVTVYGHMSRVWKSVILGDGKFITAGEDSQLRIWNDDGTPIRYWETHQGGSIRSLAVEESKNIIVTGGKDGGLCLWPLSVDSSRSSELEEIHISDIFGIKKVQEMPRRILLSRLGKLLTITNQGMLLVYGVRSWNCIINSPRFTSYCLFEISEDRRCISLASIFGDVMIVREADDGVLEIVFNSIICSGKIFSFQWLSHYDFITCCADGHIETWKLCKNISTYDVKKVSNFILPACKERWLTSAVQIDGNIIVGDRDGSVHLYADTLHPTHTCNRIHGRLGVSCINFDRNRIFSVGRDGFVRYWHVSAAKLYHEAADRLPVKWPVRVIRSENLGLVVVGFNGVNFEMWNVEERNKILAYKCGGGHRPWDFIITNEDIRFVYIKEKILYSVTSAVKDLKVSSFLEGNHIRDTDCLSFLTENFIVSAGEDTTLRISRLNKNNFKPKAIIRSHISSIKSVCFLHSTDCFLVASAGGRAQLKLWKIHIDEDLVNYEELASHMLKPTSKNKKPWQHMLYTAELEPRYMDVKLHRDKDLLSIYCAGSDAFWRVFVFDLNLRTLQLFKEIEYFGFCILKIIYVEWSNAKLVLTLATDGKATFWDALTYTIIYQKSIHQSGINSVDHRVLEDGTLLLATGGDDTAVTISLFEYVDGRIVERGCCSEAAHEAQVTGLKIIANHCISAGGDQNVLVWKWQKKCPTTLCLNLEQMYRSLIPDIHGLDVFKVSGNEFKVSVYGAGFEVLKIVFR